MEENHEHSRDHEPKHVAHRRSSDDVIIELLRVVQAMDTKLEQHMLEEIATLDRISKENADYIISLLAAAFPHDDIELHRQQHDSFWATVKHWVLSKKKS